MRARTGWVVALLLGAFAARSEAVGLPGITSSRIWHVGFAGGASVPVGDAKDALKNGFHGQGFFSIDTPSLPIGLKASLNYSHFDLKPPATPPAPGTEVTGTGSILSGLANAQVHLLPGPIRPYITAGVGAFDVGPETTTGGVETQDSKVHFGINGGAGLDFRLGAIRGFVEGRLDDIFTEKGLNQSLSGDNIKTQVVPVSVGLIF
jgi:opacity protein-like surface antigen